jgi:hypothetical protein
VLKWIGVKIKPSSTLIHSNTKVDSASKQGFNVLSTVKRRIPYYKTTEKWRLLPNRKQLLGDKSDPHLQQGQAQGP